LKFAAIDIGSNAIRLLICNVFEGKEQPVLKKSSLIRLPIRLGEDAFLSGEISERNIDRMVKAMQAFKILMEIHQVTKFKAFATSAMREAKNAAEIVKRVEKESGIFIEVIDGQKEAETIFSCHLSSKLNSKKTYLFIDVGGGSTELTVFHENKIIASHSFNIGTIRLLKNQIKKSDWEELKSWINKSVPSSANAIGTGGNINKIYKLSPKKLTKPLSLEKLIELDAFLNSFTYKERVEILGLNPDRADVIVQASKVFIMILKTAAINKIIVPQIGLSDGIIRWIYDNENSE
jgi:exopolyphosphatase / guanosine-5'-triphosphate,3'-diphosphate pyrophosphatase